MPNTRRMPWRESSSRRRRDMAAFEVRSSAVWQSPDQDAAAGNRPLSEWVVAWVYPPPADDCRVRRTSLLGGMRAPRGARGGSPVVNAATGNDACRDADFRRCFLELSRRLPGVPWTGLQCRGPFPGPSEGLERRGKRCDMRVVIVAPAHEGMRSKAADPGLRLYDGLTFSRKGIL